jgi:hypothetical protein
MRKSWLIAFALTASVGTAIAIAQQRRPASGPALDLSSILAVEADRAVTAGDIDALVAATRGKHATSAVRALGRLERRDLIGVILPLLGGESTRAAAATAAVVALKGRPLDGVPPGQQEREVLDALIAAGDLELGRREPSAIDDISRALGKIPYQDAESFKDAAVSAPERRTSRVRRPRPRGAAAAESKARIAQRRDRRSPAIDRAHDRPQTVHPAAQRTRSADRGCARGRRHA